jgi:hypothetical protein
MKLALVAVLLVFAAPAPVAETTLCLEEELLLDSARGSKSSSARAAFRKAIRQQATPASRPSRRPVETAFSPEDSSAWPPRLFSRPPPVA